jgi:hypothetical protein
MERLPVDGAVTVQFEPCLNALPAEVMFAVLSLNRVLEDCPTNTAKKFEVWR